MNADRICLNINIFSCNCSNLFLFDHTDHPDNSLIFISDHSTFLTSVYQSTIFFIGAYEKAAAENPALERIFAQERDQANVQMTLNSENYTLASEPKSNLYGALYSVLATDDPSQRKSMHYIGFCIGRAAYLMDKAESFLRDKLRKRYNVFLANGITNPEAAVESARRQALAAANDLVRAYNLLDIKLNRTLLDNIMILGLRHAVDPFQENQPVSWELP